MHVLPNFAVTTSETMCDYYLKPWYTPVSSRVLERLKRCDIKKLENIEKLAKLHRMTA